MRYLLALVLPVALAARTGQISEEKDTAIEAEDWFRMEGLGRPEGELGVIAHVLDHTADGDESHLFKIECVECPFIVDGATWTENSLLFNFTVVKSGPAILLNGESIWPLASPPPPITALQEANDERYIEVAQPLDVDGRPAQVFYEEFELEYKHYRLATEQPDLEWLQFDITGVHVRHEGRIELSYNMDKEGQRMFELLLHHGVEDNKETLDVRNMDAILRPDRRTPLKMPCGRDAMIVTEYNPREWDEFGKIGTWSHMWNSVSSESWFARNWLNIHFAVILLAIGVLIRRRRLQAVEEAAAMRAEEDAEAALLDSDDAPPGYIQETVTSYPLEYDALSEEEKSKSQL